jgi:hypothetical protein
MATKRANIFRFVHHQASNGSWSVIDIRTETTVYSGLDETTAIERALVATTKHTEWAESPREMPLSEQNDAQNFDPTAPQPDIIDFR